MSKCIYILKMCLLQHQLPSLHWSKKKKIEKMALFVVFCYLRPWFEASSIPAAATNYLLLYKSLLKFKKINKAVSTKTSTSLNRHTWYLTEDLISFSLFNDDIPVEERTLLAAKIRREAAPGDLEIRKPTLPTKLPSPRTPSSSTLLEDGPASCSTCWSSLRTSYNTTTGTSLTTTRPARQP